MGDLYDTQLAERVRGGAECMSDRLSVRKFHEKRVYS